MMPATEFHAVATAAGLNWPHDTAMRARTVLRECVENGDLAPFAFAPMTFIRVTSTAAAISIASAFTGQAMIVFTRAQPGAAPIHAGFYRRGAEGDLYHADSAEFEDLVTPHVERGDQLWLALCDAGVNPAQSLEACTLGEPCTLMLCGTVAEYWDLRNNLGPLRREAHPASREAVKSIWADIKARQPLIAEAFEQATR
jgi:hypothetical protein